MLLLLSELIPSGITRYASDFGMAHQIILAFSPGRCLKNLDSARAQREPAIRHHQTIVHPNHTAKAFAGGASSVRRVEGKQAGRRLGVANIAFRAMQAGGKFPDLLPPLFTRIHIHAPASALQSQLNRLHHAHFFSALDLEPIRHHIQHLARPGGRRHLALGLHACETAGREPLLHLLRGRIPRQLHRKSDDQARVQRLSLFQELGINRLTAIVAHGQRCFAV